MDVTLSIDQRTLERAQRLAQERGTSLNQLIQEYLVELTTNDPAQAIAELERLWNEEEGDSGGWSWNREEVHDLTITSRNPSNPAYRLSPKL